MQMTIVLSRVLDAGWSRTAVVLTLARMAYRSLAVLRRLPSQSPVPSCAALYAVRHRCGIPYGLPRIRDQHEHRSGDDVHVMTTPRAQHVHYVDEMKEVLADLGDRLHVLAGTNTDSGRATRTAAFDGVADFKVEKDTLFDALTECRVVRPCAVLVFGAHPPLCSRGAWQDDPSSSRPPVAYASLPAELCTWLHSPCRLCRSCGA